MVAVALITLLAATAVLVGASLPLASLVSTLLAVYLALVGEIALLTTFLSPVRAVTRGWLFTAELVLLAVALAVWWIRGRPTLPLQTARPAMRSVVTDPVALGLLVVAGLALAYELVLVLTAPPNNWDSLTYHLPRAAAWAQHGGVYWIPNAPTDRMNEFQPLAEQEVLYLFVATGKGSLFALPQFVAQLAAMLGIYGTSRRLGYAPRAAACGALLFCTFTIVALEATTAQNDLVAASLVVIAAALLLGDRPVESALAGIAIGLAAGVKMTVVFALPVLVALAVLRGRKQLVVFGGAAVGALAAVGAWGYIRNIAETGHALGHGGGRVEHTATPSFPGSLATAFRVTYRLFDLSGFADWMVWTLVVLALMAAVFIAAASRAPRRVPLLAAAVAAVTLPLLVPALAIGLARVARAFADLVNLPVHDAATTSASFSWQLNRSVNEDLSAFGPLGVVALGVSLVTVVAYVRGRTDVRRLALALALPVFIVLLGLSSKYNPWLARFLIVPLALTAPLFAGLFRRREAAFALTVVAATTVTLAHLRNDLKPIEGADVLPWRQTQAQAVALPWLGGLHEAQRQLDRLVPASTCLGALLDRDDPTFLLYGSHFDRHLTFLTVPGEWQRAEREGLKHIIINGGDYQDARGRMKERGWRLRDLSGYWVLATSPVRGGPCPPAATPAG